MPSYSVATTKDKLSSLIDKALAGEEVVITNHGKPKAELVRAGSIAAVNVPSATARLRKRIEGQPKLAIPSQHFRDWLYEDEDY